MTSDEDTRALTRAAVKDDRAAIDALLDAAWDGTVVATSEHVYDLRTLPTIVVTIGGAYDGEIVGVLTYQVAGDAIEVVSINAPDAGRGIGTALLLAAADVGRIHGLTRLWLITTNDNLDAIRFYQRRGLAITEVRPGAVARARRFKPGIPMIGAYGIPLRDEIVLSMSLVDGDTGEVTSGSDTVTP